MKFGIRKIANDGNVVELGSWSEGPFDSLEDAGRRVQELEQVEANGKFTISELSDTEALLIAKNHQPALYYIVPSLDYLQVVCVKCNETCAIDYKGLDPSIPLLEITCPHCGSSGEWKLDQAGIGFYTNTRERQAS